MVLEGNKRKYLMIGVVIIGVYFFMKFLSPIVSPFLLAFLIAGALSRLTEKIPIKQAVTIKIEIILFNTFFIFSTSFFLIFFASFVNLFYVFSPTNHDSILITNYTNNIFFIQQI